MEEHRATPRQRVLKAGTISFNGDAGISCTVRNLSATGAALEVASPLGIPNQFTLVFDGDRHARACHIVWRKERRIGIAFDEP
ncbi:MAG: PilZ domain-containing protein [Pseudomonadota bacterium]|jgi:hypothetical protein